VSQEGEFGDIPIFPAVSMAGFFVVHIARETWRYAPPAISEEGGQEFLPWADATSADDHTTESVPCGILPRPPPSWLANLDIIPSTTEAKPQGQVQSAEDHEVIKPPNLERSRSKVPDVAEELSAATLPEFAKAVARKVLVTNLEPYLGLVIDGFRKVIGPQAIDGVTWQALQEAIAGRDLDPAKWVEDWKERTTYKDCSESDEYVEYWWAFVTERSAEELPKLFEWCTNFPAVPATAWKFHITLLDDANRLPTINTCMTDDPGLANRGVPEPRLHLPPCKSLEALRERMSQVSWQSGAASAMTYV